MKDIGGMPTNLLLPYKDKHKRTQWLNLEYILPVGQAPEIAERGLAGFISNPLFTISADLTKNKDFRGKNIIRPEATTLEATQDIMGYVYRQLAPSLAPKGYSWEKIRAGAVEEPEKFNPERTRELIPAILDTMVGLKINPMDVDDAESLKIIEKKKRLGEIKSEIYRVITNPVLKEDYKEKKYEELFKKQQKILEE